MSGPGKPYLFLSFNGVQIEGACKNCHFGEACYSDPNKYPNCRAMNVRPKLEVKKGNKCVRRICQDQSCSSEIVLTARLSKESLISTH